MPKTYKIERRVIDVKTGWFKSEKQMIWCLVECGTRVYYSHGGSRVDADEFDYNDVIFKSEDFDVVQQEYNNFIGVLI